MIDYQLGLLQDLLSAIHSLPQKHVLLIGETTYRDTCSHSSPRGNVVSGIICGVLTEESPVAATKLKIIAVSAKSVAFNFLSPRQYYAFFPDHNASNLKPHLTLRHFARYENGNQYHRKVQCRSGKLTHVYDVTARFVLFF